MTSDYAAIGELMNHAVAGDLATAARKAIEAGVHLDMEAYAYTESLAGEVAAGRLGVGDRWVDLCRLPDETTGV